MKFSLSSEEEKKYLSLFNQHEKNLDYLIYLGKVVWEKPSSSLKIDSGKDPFEKRNILFEELIKEHPFPNEFVKKNMPWDTNLLRINEYNNNPYLKALNNLSFRKDGWTLESKTLKAYSLFPKEEEYMMGSNYNLKMNIGFFDKDYVYPSLRLYDTEWMSLNPYEIRTMEIPIQLAKGKVLTLGLGLGYYAYMVHLKKDVKEVHIVEMDLELIRIFNEYLLPLFPCKEKIHIHKADAFYFAKQIKDRDYDFIFSDIWHDVGDGLSSYLKLKRAFKSFTYTRCTYWIEGAILTYLKLLTIGLLQDEYHKNDQDYDDLQLYIKERLSNYEFSNSSDLDSLLSVKGLEILLL